ncbi:MAG: hypothetical protein AAF658_02100 [Myxococcota bacterium]
MELSLLDSVKRAELAQARSLAHHLVQPLAAISTVFVSAEPDDGHTTLRWHESNGLVTKPTSEKVSFGIDLATMEAMMIEDSVLREPIAGWTLARLWDWYQEKIDEVFGEDTEELVPRDYGESLPAHPVADGEQIPGPTDSTRALSVLFEYAFELLGAITDGSEGWSSIRNWPHHFDVATILNLDPDSERSVNVGMSPGDGFIDAPYLYVTPWPAPDVSAAPDLPGAGRWNSDGFTAAVIEVLGAERPTLEEFLSFAVSAAKQLLAR